MDSIFSTAWLFSLFFFLNFYFLLGQYTFSLFFLIRLSIAWYSFFY